MSHLLKSVESLVLSGEFLKSCRNSFKNCHSGLPGIFPNRQKSTPDVAKKQQL
ncbi:MAG: hypothetical protein V4642_00950 [Bacteroidota bacterium]